MPLPVPALVTEEVSQRVQDTRAHNQQRAARNTPQEYLLRGHVSCGPCRLTAGSRTTPAGYGSSVCVPRAYGSRTDRRRLSPGHPGTAR